MEPYQMKLIQLLLEYDRNVTINNFKSKLIPKLKRDQLFQRNLVSHLPQDRRDDDQIVDLAVTNFEQADPTNHKQYVPWLVRTYYNSDMSVEDVASRIGDALTKYERMKNRRDVLPADKRDINKFKTFAEFELVIDQYAPALDSANKNKQAKERLKGNIEEINNDGKIRIIKLLDVDAAKYYGQGTKWCTAADSNNMFDSYNGDGPLYIIFDLVNNRKYQIHPASGQFMDEQDRAVKIRNKDPDGNPGSKINPNVISAITKWLPVIVLATPIQFSEIASVVRDELCRLTPQDVCNDDSVDPKTTERLLQLMKDYAMCAISYHIYAYYYSADEQDRPTDPSSGIYINNPDSGIYKNWIKMLIMVLYLDSNDGALEDFMDEYDDEFVEYVAHTPNVKQIVYNIIDAVTPPASARLTKLLASRA